MPTETLAAYAQRYGLIPPHGASSTPIDPRALKLIQNQRALDMNSREAQALKLPLEAWIKALLQFSADVRFIKYDPWDERILVKFFPGSLVAYQYNPFRDPGNRHAEGQKAPVPSGPKPDFLAWESFPENEHYLVWTSGNGCRYGILIQPAPIVPDHLIIASLDYAHQGCGHFEQVMTPQHLDDLFALQQALNDIGYAFAFNGRGAGASVDHFHTQAIPAQYLPLIQHLDAGRLNVATSRQHPAGATVFALDGGYPVNGIGFRSRTLQQSLDLKKALINHFLSENLTFNSISWKSAAGDYAEVFFPRGQEQILNQKIKAGYVEMSGMLVIPNRDLFDNIQANQGEDELKITGAPIKIFDSCLKSVLAGFSA